jgi:predicted metal-dependent hydrolase
MLRALEEPASPPARWTDAALPPYRHVPGLTPHPLKHPGGHSYGGGIWQGSGEEVFDPERWRESSSYLLGVDLFNQAYLWEAHEAWEEVWNAVDRGSMPGRMAQGMIQVAAALLKLHMEVPGGAVGNYRKASAHFDWIEQQLLQRKPEPPSYLGVDLRSWRSAVERYLARGTRTYPFLMLGGTGA